MATWADLRQYIAAHYRITEDIGRGIKLGFQLPNNRGQFVYITSWTIGGGEEWATVESPIGKLGEVDLGAAVRFIGDKVIGGIALSTDFDEVLVTVRHSIPLANLDPNEFDGPLQTVTLAADELEAQLTGRDMQ